MELSPSVKAYLASPEAQAAMERVAAMTPEQRSRLTQQPTVAFEWDPVKAADDYVARYWAMYTAADWDKLPSDLVLAAQSILKDGRGFYLWGGPGVGKTWALVALFKLLARQHEEVALISWLDMRDQIQSDFDKPAHDRREAHYFRTVGVLLIDDFASGRMTEWAAETLAQIIEHRQRNNRLTLITSNYARQQLPSVIGGMDGERIASRIAALCDGYHMVGKDRRLA